MAKTRTRQMVGDLARKTILAERNDDRVYQFVLEAAVYFGTAGFLPAANRMLSNLWSRGLPHSRNPWYADRALKVLWNSAGERPAHVPFPLEAIDEIELQHRCDMATHGGQSTPNTHLNSRQAAFARFLRGMDGIQPIDGVMPRADVELAAIRDLEAFYQPGLAGYNAYLMLTNIAELCAKNGKIEDAKRWTTIWYDTYVEYWCNFRFPSLAANRHLAPLLLDGLLSQRCGLTLAKSNEMVDELLTALDRRFRGEIQLPHASLGWRALLERLSEVAIAAAWIEFPDSAQGTKWLGHPPASAREISDAEGAIVGDVSRRLRGLPEGTSNGFDDTSSTSARIFAVAERRMVNRRTPRSRSDLERRRQQ